MITRSTRTTLAKLLAVLFAFTLIAAACGSDDGDSTNAETTDNAVDATGGEGNGGDDNEATPPAEQVDDAAVGVGEEEATATVSDEPVRGGTLRIAVEAEGDGLNPTANNFAASAYVMGYPVFDPLFYVDTNGDWFPFLAESATPIGDGSSWEIKLRPGIKFHDGTPLNAEALVANFEAAIQDPIISLAIVPSYPAENRTEIIDDLTVRYNLIRPSQQFPVNLTSQLGMVASPTWLAAAALDEGLNQEPVGTGPFRFDSRDIGEMTRLVRNEDYWQGTENIYLDAIEILPITDGVIAAERVGTGEIDMIVTSNPEAQLTLEDAGVQTASNLLGSEDDIMMNTSRPPFDDIRVRQALTFATDREGYADLIGQGTKPLANSFFNPDLIWNNPDVVQEGNDPDRAAPLIAEYCGENPGNCTDGKVNMELQFSGPSVTQTLIMDLLIGGWQDYFNVTRQELLQPDHITEVAFGLWDVVTWRQFGAVDPDNEVIWLECATASSAIALNWPRVCDPARDELLFEQRATTSQERRVEIWQQIAVDVKETYAYVFLTHTNWVVGFNDNVKNLCGQKGPDGQDMICNASGSIFVHNAWVE
jgi:peptide/nickel transport system substrate-binding protein